MKPETKFRGKVLEFLKTLLNTHIFAIQQASISGDPDYILCMRGVLVCLELKAKNKKLRPLQEFVSSRVEKSGGIYLEANPDNWDEIKEFLTFFSTGEFPYKDPATDWNVI